MMILARKDLAFAVTSGRRSPMMLLVREYFDAFGEERLDCCYCFWREKSDDDSGEEILLCFW